MRTRWLETARRRAGDPRVIDVLLVACSAGLTALAVKTPWSPLPRWVVALAGLAGSLALGWHRRHPLAVTAAGAAAHALSGNPGPLLVGLCSGAATRRRVTHLLALAVTGTAGFAALDWVEGAAPTRNGVSSAALLSAAVLALGAYAGMRRDLVTALRERATAAEGQRRLREERARTEERARIAREMHDVLAHKLSLIALHAGALEVDDRADAARVHEEATLIGATAREALDELRTVLGLLRSAAAAAGGAPLRDQFADIRLLVQAWQRAGARVALHDAGGGVLPPAIARAAYRLVQEGLTNAHKHAPGAAVEVTISGGAGREVVVAVVNDAAGGRSAGLPGAGSGLMGLRERLRLVGGTLVSGRHHGGWRLEGRFPWPRPGAADPAHDDHDEPPREDPARDDHEPPRDDHDDPARDDGSMV